MSKKSRKTRTAGKVAVALILAFPLPSGATEPTTVPPLTLEKTIKLVQGHHPSLKAAIEDISAADARVTQSKSGYYPQISAAAGYTAITPVSEMSFGGGAPVKFMPNDNYEVKVTAKMNLLDFGRRDGNVDLALSGKKMAEQSLDLSRRELSWQTVQLFYGTLFLRESIKVEETQITALNKALDYAKKRYQAGTATPFDVFSTEVRIAAARNRTLDLEHELRSSELTLYRLTGIEETHPLRLEGSFAATTTPDHVTTGLVAQALAQRVEAKLTEEQEKMAQQRHSLAMKESLPVVTGALSVGFNNGYQPDIYQIRNNVAGNLRVEVPLFTGYHTSAKEQESAAMVRAAAQRKVDTRQQIQNDVEESVHALQTSSEKIVTTEAQVKQAELAAQHARIRYENGMATTLDLLDTEASLAQAELARLQAAYACILNNYKLKRATGKL